MGALEQLSKIVENARRVAQSDSLHKEYQHAVQNMAAHGV